MADFMMYLIDAIIRHGPVVREFRLAPEGGRSGSLARAA